MATLDNIIARLSADTAAIEKTASAESAPRDVATSVDPTEQMLSTVRALSAKTASAAAPSTAAVPALDKIAADVAAAEEAALQKMAAVAGAAICDNFMSRLAQYDTMIGTKTAGAAGYSQADLEAAYQKGQNDLEKQAAAEYERGQNAALEELHKVASELHVAGQQSARNVLIALSK